MGQQLLIVRVAGELYAVPTSSVREVLGSAPRRRLPATGTPWVVGLASVRGRLVAVVDVATRLGAAPGGDDGALVVLEADGQSAALAVEAVERLVTVADDLPPAPAYAGDAADAIAEVDGDLIVVLRPAALLPPA